MSDVLITSPILRDPSEAPAPGAEETGGGGGFEFGFDPSLDPELALVRVQPHPPTIPLCNLTHHTS
jgi:hypothetical protein